jgi:ribosomal-protein-alanine N-acetyltransferase
MIRLLRGFFSPAEEVAAACPADSPALAGLHRASFARGWSEDEFERLLLQRDVVAHTAMGRRRVAGFIMSRIAADEAEILSVAVVSSRRGRGVAGRLLDHHLRVLSGRGVRAVFLEVDATNLPARRLYARRGFREVGRRETYYPAAGTNALVLRRDLA